MRRATVNGIELEYEVTGAGDPVLLISPVLADGEGAGHLLHIQRSAPVATVWRRSSGGMRFTRRRGSSRSRGWSEPAQQRPWAAID